MGYYINTESTDWVIPTDKINDAYKALCDLNNRNDLKSGGIFPQDESLKDSNTPTPSRWFAWMDANYHETCSTLQEILQMLGFDPFEVDGGLEVGSYNSKTGSQDIFLAALAPFTRPDSWMTWAGEDGERWRTIVKDGVAYEQEIIEIVYGNERAISMDRPVII